ncbi:E3 ubiquitin-protein ligase AIRP1-like isoform X1 [Schistocerca piceifrons]|uniref:E3 ubiquitin-protein ligase AIRP1-like isoform X1 n=1 Tax=Schistocerca piceifrons TaxID=274613 RepID=UPI001F5EF01E|nr:E3 ubiquitin-protein ligase AIRP1-like isoform X1 [Schistocerca piceifrons]
MFQYLDDFFRHKLPQKVIADGIMTPRHSKRVARTVPKTVAFIDLTDSPSKINNFPTTFRNNASSEENVTDVKKCCLHHSESQTDKTKQGEEKNSLDDSACPICLENLEFFSPSQGRQVMSTLCGHLFCQNCITSVLKSSKECPTCCRRLKLSDIHPIFIP